MFTVTVTEAVDVTDAVKVLRLARSDGSPLPGYPAGAHIDVTGPTGITRPYSLCGPPHDPGAYTIAVKREETSRGGSHALHDKTEPGTELRIGAPRQLFGLDPGATEHHLVAGGIGITPLLPMVEQLAEAGADWQLLYGGRRRASMAFRDRLAELGDRVAIRPEDEYGLLDLDSVLGEPRPGTLVYCCGPEPLLQAVELRCASWPAGSLHLERFKARPGALEGPSSTFEVVLERSGMTLSVGPDESIVEVIEASGISVETSCREGTCGTCETEVIEGIPDHRDSFLMDDERADNRTMMICCSRSLSPRLVLDL